MVGVYFSGTGNTAWCAERFLQSCAPEGAAVAMEDPAAVELLRLHDEVLLAYPVYYSNLPKIVRDFIQGSAPLWEGKSVFVIATTVVVGGTSLAGGKGGVVNTIVGVLIMTVLDNGLVMLNVNPNIRTGVQGVIILVAVILTAARGAKVISK